MVNEPGDVAIAGVGLLTGLINLLHRKGVLSEEEVVEFWREQARINEESGQSNKVGVAEILKHLAPGEAGL